MVHCVAFSRVLANLIIVLHDKQNCLTDVHLAGFEQKLFDTIKSFNDTLNQLPSLLRIE